MERQQTIIDRLYMRNLDIQYNIVYLFLLFIFLLQLLQDVLSASFSVSSFHIFWGGLFQWVNISSIG